MCERHDDSGKDSSFERVKNGEHTTKRQDTVPVFFAANATSRMQPKRQENLSFRGEKYASKTFRKVENKAKGLLVLL